MNSVEDVKDATEKEIMKKLQAPFRPDEIEWRVGRTNEDKAQNKPATKGLALAYVTNRAIQNRLDEVFGPFGWQNEFREWKNASQICGISVYNDLKMEWITKWDGADDSQMEAVKGGLSDSMKRAACQWGIGRYLYDLEPVWVPLKQVGKSYVLVETPELPAWALPEGYTQKRQPLRVVEPEKQQSIKTEKQPPAAEQEGHHHALSPDEHRQRVLEMAQAKGFNEAYMDKWVQRNFKDPNLRVATLNEQQLTRIERYLEKAV